MTTSLTVLAVAATVMTVQAGTAQSSATGLAQEPVEHVHVVNTFRFEVASAMGRVAPLFAPEAERGWAGEHAHSGGSDLCANCT